MPDIGHGMAKKEVKRILSFKIRYSLSGVQIYVLPSPHGHSRLLELSARLIPCYVTLPLSFLAPLPVLADLSAMLLGQIVGSPFGSQNTSSQRLLP